MTARVSECGVGRPFVFLHGLVGLNDHWEDAVRLMRRDRARCVMLELPLLALEGDNCSIHAVVDMTAHFLETYVGEPSVLVGNSFGGHVALRLALDRPELVKGLVLAGSSGLNEQTMVQEIQLKPKRDWLADRIGELFFDRSKMRMADVDRAHMELTKRTGARAMVKLSRSARRNQLRDRLGDIRVPTLIIWGREDVVTPPEAAHEFAARIPGSKLVWFDRCGHVPMIECPDQFVRAMEEFNDELDRRG